MECESTLALRDCSTRSVETLNEARFSRSPLLRRLEAQGLLTSEWREEDKRNKRFYRLSADGQEIFVRLLKEWNEINTAIANLL